MMLVAKSDIKLIYQELLKEGVLVCPKDTRLPVHQNVSVSNLAVMNVMKSLKSRAFVTEQFSWQWYYFRVTDEGIAFLRSYLHAPETTIPATLVNKAGSEGQKSERSTGMRRSPRTPTSGFRGPRREQSTTA